MTILTAVDGEHVPSRPVEVGAELARKCDEELVVLHVMPQDVFDERRDEDHQEGFVPAPMLAPAISYREPGTEVSETGTTGDDGARDEHEYTIEDGEDDAAGAARTVVEETLDDPGQLTVQGRVGEPVEQIVDEIDRQDARYLVVGGRKRTPVEKTIFGSTSQSVLQNADVPVMTVRND